MASVTDVDVNREIEKAMRVADYVVDADQHVNPPPTMWSEYLSPQFRAQAPTLESDGEFDYVCFEPSEHGVKRIGELTELVCATFQPDPVGE